MRPRTAPPAAALTVPGATDPCAVDPGLRSEEARRRLCVSSEGVDRERVRRVSREHAARLAHALLVERRPPRPRADYEQAVAELSQALEHVLAE
jgi:hypothetical protein